MKNEEMKLSVQFVTELDNSALGNFFFNYIEILFLEMIS